MKRTGDIAALALLFLVTYLQFRHIWFYHDDYGYASLSYGLGTPMGEVTFGNILRYLRWHYQNIGGRVLFFFFQITAMQLGVQGFMLVQSVLVGLILFTLYKTCCLIRNAETARQKALILLLLLSLYLLVRFNVYRDSLFWASAASLYVWPQLPLGFGVFLAYAYAADERRRSAGALVCVGLCFFMAGFSQEQTALSAVVFMPAFALSVLGKEARKHKRLLLSGLLPALAGLALLYGAPGNYARMVYKAEPLPDLSTAMLALPGSTAYILSRIFSAEFGLLLFLSLALTALAWPGHKKRILAAAPFWIMALAAAAVLCIAPVRGQRMLFPTLLWLSAGASMALSLWEERRGGALLVLAVALFLFSAHSYYRRVFSGYRANYATSVLNDVNLRRAAQENPPPALVTFYRLPRRSFHNGMPYHDRLYIEVWIKNYYRLPLSTRFRYEASPYAVKEKARVPE